MENVILPKLTPLETIKRRIKMALERQSTGSSSSPNSRMAPLKEASGAPPRSTLGAGRTTKRQALEFKSTRMEINTRVAGSTESVTARGLFGC